MVSWQKVIGDVYFGGNGRQSVAVLFGRALFALRCCQRCPCLTHLAASNALLALAALYLTRLTRADTDSIASWLPWSRWVGHCSRLRRRQLKLVGLCKGVTEVVTAVLRPVGSRRDVEGQGGSGDSIVETRVEGDREVGRGPHVYPVPTAQVVRDGQTEGKGDMHTKRVCE